MYNIWGTYSEMWCHVVWSKFVDILEERAVFTFRIEDWMCCIVILKLYGCNIFKLFYYIIIW
jgi:hypothetical protein